MRLSPLVFSILLSAPFVANAQSAQTGAPTAPPSSSNAAQAVSPGAQWSTQQNAARLRAQLQAELPPRMACPVAFSAQREGAWGLLATERPNKPDARLGQGLDLSFRTPAHAIVEADIIVHGMTPQTRIIPVPAGASEDAAEEFTLEGTADHPITLSSVWTKRLATVSWVELTRLVFSDGTTWTQTGDTHCISRPSMLVLVGGSTQSR